MHPATRTFECIVCGGSLDYVAGAVAVRCATCDDDRPLPLRFADAVPARPIEAADARTGPLPGHRHTRCGSCRALLSRPATDACPLCGAEPVDDAGTALAVDGWLPFLVHEQAARSMLTAKLGRERIAATPMRLVRVHVPFVVYECVLRGSYEGRRGETTDDGHGRRVTWQAVSGVIDRHLQHRRRSASRSVFGELAEQLEPWDWAFVEPPSASISEIAAERTELPGLGIASRALGDLDAALAEEACTDIGGELQEVVAAQATRTAERFRHVLLPVWVGVLSDGATRFAVNGRTGAVVLDWHASHGIQDLEGASSPGRGPTMIVLAAMAVVAAILVGAMLL